MTQRPRVPPGAVLPAALVLLFGLLGAVVAGMVSQAGGTFVYTLDDPYIHLALAREIAAGHYGLHAGEAAAPSSSVLWPFLLAPLARVPVGLFLPLALNAACAAGTLGVLHGVFRRSLGGPTGDAATGLRLLLLALAVPAFGLVVLAVSGMEHALQVLLAVAGVAGLAESAAGRRVPWWAFAALVVGPFVRYENLALTLPALAFLFAQGERRASAAALAVVVVGLGAFSAALLAAGLGPLPSSILVKQAVASQGLLHGVAARLKDTVTDPHGVLLLAGALVLSALVLRVPARPRAERGLAAVAVAAVALHALAGAYLYRYTVYVTAVVAVVALVLHAPALLARWHARPAATAALAATAVVSFAGTALFDLATAPLAARNIYEQQAQMARFVAEEYRRPVAVNDLGLVAYRSPAYVLDLFGLGSIEAVRARRADTAATGAWMGTLAAAHHADLAMIYPDWFPPVPAAWVPLGTLAIGTKNVALGGSDVAFFATRAAAAPDLAARLARFRPTLPAGVTFEPFSPRPPAPAHGGLPSPDRARTRPDERTPE